MVEYITIEDVDLKLGADWADEAKKPKSVLSANAWLTSLNLCDFGHGDIPDDVKQAGAYAAEVASKGKLYQQVDSGSLTSKTVNADGASVSKSYAELNSGSTTRLDPDLQLALALLSQYGVNTHQVRLRRG
ncbi:protein singed [Providencia rettgeri]